MLLAMADRRLGIAERLARCFPDRRDPLRITHTLADMVRARILAIACDMKMPTISTLCALIPLSSSLAGGCQTRREPVFTADALAVGERAFAEGCDPAHVGARRSMDGLL